MKNVFIYIGLVWLLAAGIVGLAMTLVSKQSREREEQMDRDEERGEE